MKNFKVLFLLVTLITTMSFGEAIKEGPLYLNHKHYNSTYDKFLEDTIHANKYQFRFWIEKNFGSNTNASHLASVAKATARLAKKVSKTHIANKWFFTKIKPNQSFLMGFYEDLGRDFSFIGIKRIGDEWRFSCDLDSWFLLREGDYEYCKSEKGTNIIKFEFFKPYRDKGWRGDEVMYRFSVVKD